MADFRKEAPAEKSLIDQLREQTTQLLEAHRAMAARLQEMTDQLTQLERQPLRVSA
jgi:hypothetical protein